MDGLLTNLAASESERRNGVDAQHLSNMNSINSNEMSWNRGVRKQADADLIGGLSLIADAVKGAKWGKEEETPKDNQGTTSGV